DVERHLVDETGDRHSAVLLTCVVEKVAEKRERGSPLKRTAPCSNGWFWSLRSSGGRNDVDDLAAALRSELDRTGREREQGVVPAASDVVAGVEVGATLTHDDLTGVDELAAEALHAEALRIGVAAVLGGRCALLVCHVSVPQLIPVILTWVYF